MSSAGVISYVYRVSFVLLIFQMGGGYPTDLNPGSESFEHIVRSHRDVYEDAAASLQASLGDEFSTGGGDGSVSPDAPGAAAAGEVAKRW